MTKKIRLGATHPSSERRKNVVSLQYPKPLSHRRAKSELDISVRMHAGRPYLSHHQVGFGSTLAPTAI
jgi:hypothetical protein